MTLKLALVFNFDQLTSERVVVADRAAYAGLLTVLRTHPTLKFNLHLSGTVLRALNWLQPETLDLVRAGLADGQFELLGGQHAQNVAYASDDRDNRLQLQVHTRVLADVLGVRPHVFWNAGRAWRDSLLPVIAEAGYDVMLLEDRILRAAGVAAPTPVRFVGTSGIVTTICDDVPLRDRLRWAVWYGRDAELWRSLDEAQERARSAAHWLAASFDAEAFGLLGLEAGYLPNAHWAALDKVLTQIETRELAVEHLSAARARQEITTAPETASVEMDRAAVTAGARQHEPGFESYLDFATRSPKLGYFRKLFSVVRASFNDTGSVLGTQTEPPAAALPPAGARFLALAEEVYAAHQHGFGALGVGGREYWAWENVRHTFLYLRLAQLAADPAPRRWIEDLNGDGNDEQIWCDGRQLAMFSGYGGRLIGWFDLKHGAVWVGNPLAIPQARYIDGASAHPKVTPVAPRWLPAPGIDLRPYKALREKEPAPPKLAGEVDLATFPREPESYWVYRSPAEPVEAVPALHIQHGALNDWWSTDGVEQPASTFIDYRFEDDGIAYVNAGLPDVVIHKRIALVPHGITASYQAQNRSGRRRTLGWRLTHELNPGYAEVLARGRGGLDPIQAPDGIGGVANRVNDASVTVTCSRAWDSTAWSAGLLALEVEGSLALDLPARGTLAWQVELKAH